MNQARASLLAAAAVAAAAFLLYHATLLPGQDLGDTASFQATIGSSYLTPRQAYPLYYATGNLFVAVMPGNAARAINMASAVFGAIACGLLAAVVAALSGWALAGAAAGLLFAASYTFWSQAIIAEVYALHAFMMGACLLALVAWARRPTPLRLAVFFALYAVGFGNHLQMILLLPGFALFLVLVAPGGPLSMIRPRVAILAVAMAALGASQYLWNLQALLNEPDRDHRLLELLRTVWFDVTKADWRATMVAGIPEGALQDRIRMYWFDLHQQFGSFGVLLALLGLIWALWPGRLSGPLGRVSRPRVGLALVVLFLVNWGFAFTYNVGDAHVFYLPSHFIVALFAGLGAGALLTVVKKLTANSSALSPNETRTHFRVLPVVAGLMLVAYPAWQAYDTFPALDRSNDWQVKHFFDRLANGLDHDRDVFATDLNWQLHNGLDYYTKYDRPDLGVVDTTEALLYFPLIVNSNREIGRATAVTDGARPMLAAAYGPLFDIERDARVSAPSFSERIARFSPGTPYLLTFLEPYDDVPVDRHDLDVAVGRLTGDRVHIPAGSHYNAVAGRVGDAPTFTRFEERPFRTRARAGDTEVDIRMECWLPADTIRRMGFGRAIVGRNPVLTIDRGASFVALANDGGAPGSPRRQPPSGARVEYGWAILAPQPRWIIPVAAAHGSGLTAQGASGSGH